MDLLLLRVSVIGHQSSNSNRIISVRPMIFMTFLGDAMSRNNDAEIFDLVAKVVASKYSAY